MATPNVTIDGTTQFRASEMNKYTSAGGVKLNVAQKFARVRSNGATLEVSGNTDSAVIVTGDLAFNAGNDSVDITLAGYTNPPLILVVPAITTAYFPQLDSTTLTNVLAQILFFDRNDLSSQTSVTVGDTNIDFNIYIIGE